MRTLANRPHRYRRKIIQKSEQGQSLLEFALIVPVLFIMLLGVTVIAQGFNLQMTLYGAAYEGARVWAKNPAGGDANHCTPPACDPDEGTSINFEKYVIPVVRQYISTNGFDGAKAHFFSMDQQKYLDTLRFVGDQKHLVQVTVLYPYELPLGSFAVNFKEVVITASCTLKRGS